MAPPLLFSSQQPKEVLAKGDRLAQEGMYQYRWCQERDKVSSESGLITDGRFFASWRATEFFR